MAEVKLDYFKQMHHDKCVILSLMLPVADKSNLVTPGLEAGWEKVLDPKTGRYYYINHRTKKSQWEPPQFVGTAQGRSY